MPILLFYIFLISLLISLTITGLLRRIKYVTKENIPQSGGIAIWFSFLITSLSLFIFKRQQFLFSKEIIGIYVCSTLIFIIGLIDDKRELSVFAKLLTQLVITLIVMIFGVITQIVGIGVLGNIFVTLLWILGITNAFNHLDIVDGLSAGIALICVLTFYIFSIITHNILGQLLLVALAGSILGFLKYNFPYARIYMGNSGSHFLGFILSALAITISYASLDKRIALLIPLLVLGFPLFDTIFVMWIRLLKHKPIWSKSNDHLPLRLISSGLSKKITVIYMFSLAMFFSVCSILILYLPNILGIVVLIMLVIFCFYIALKAKKIQING